MKTSTSAFAVSSRDSPPVEDTKQAFVKHLEIVASNRNESPSLANIKASAGYSDK